MDPFYDIPLGKYTLKLRFNLSQRVLMWWVEGPEGEGLSYTGIDLAFVRKFLWFEVINLRIPIFVGMMYNTGEFNIKLTEGDIVQIYHNRKLVHEIVIRTET